MARRKRQAFSRVSRLVGPVRSITARGGKKMLQKVMVRRFKRGIRMMVVVLVVELSGGW